MSAAGESAAEERYEAIVVGTGFAGAVTACRLSEAGFHVLVLERGRRYQPSDFPVYPKVGVSQGGNGVAGAAQDRVPDMSRAFWKLGQGLWDLRDLGDVVVAQAAGFGGGSLIYANVHLRAPVEVFDESWPDVYRREALDPYYDLAAFMLQVAPLPQRHHLGKTRALEDAAAKLGHSVFRPPLAVNFEDRTDDFGVVRPACDLRGDCCFGCSRGAKNTLDLNYLARAERAGAAVETLAEVLWFEQSKDAASPGYVVHYKSHAYDDLRDVSAPFVFLCAGAVNSTELLLKSRAAGVLRTAVQPGKRYFPNSDTLAVSFDCNELHEADRGPTITSALHCDHEPDDGDTLARWVLRFRKGGDAPGAGSRICGRSGATATLARPPILHSGSWDEHTAAGELVLSELRGAFSAGEPIRTADQPFAIADSAARKSGHWMLVQDGGMPEALEPLLGMFRSPLWVRRNRFRESDQRPDADRPSRNGYADLPFRSLAELGAGLPRGALDGAPALRSELLAGSRWIPEQLIEALRRDRAELLDDFSASAEPLVGDFLDQAAARFDADERLEHLLHQLESFSFDAGGIAEIELGRQVLNLAIQLAFGSEALLVRSAVEMLIQRAVPDSRGLSTRLFEILRWAIDYRLSDGRTAILLAMGRDSLPGELSLVADTAPEPGTRITGSESGAAGVVVSASVDAGTSWALGNASGALVLAVHRGRFRKGEPLCGAPGIGVALVDSQDLSISDPSGQRADPSEAIPTKYTRLCLLRFGPPQSVDARRVRYQMQRLAAAPLRVRLPHPFDSTERASQERLLRDIAECWDGELRTNPGWSFLGRQITVHSQGGCAMGKQSGEGVTNAYGEVEDCPGLYVMDAAAFPTSVGVNPSATIAAIAEYKVERFIQKVRDVNWKATDFARAGIWAQPRRAMLDPVPARNGMSAPLRSRPIGIEFDEEMMGELEPSGDGDGGIQPITAALHAKIGDLTRFLEHHRRGNPQPIEVTGRVEIGLPDQRRLFHVLPGSAMRLFSNMVEETGTECRAIEYALALASSPNAAATHRLDGWKNLRDEEGFDVWKDSTTLAFTLSPVEGGAPQGTGMLRLPPDLFFGKQLPSFRATGTADRARQSWALAAFGKFFLGHLVDIYVPEFDRVVDVVKSLVERTHD